VTLEGITAYSSVTSMGCRESYWSFRQPFFFSEKFHIEGIFFFLSICKCERWNQICDSDFQIEGIFFVAESFFRLRVSFFGGL